MDSILQLNKEVTQFGVRGCCSLYIIFVQDSEKVHCYGFYKNEYQTSHDIRYKYKIEQ